MTRAIPCRRSRRTAPAVLAVLCTLSLGPTLAQTSPTAPKPGDAAPAPWRVAAAVQPATPLAALTDPQQCPAQPTAPTRSTPLTLEQALYASVCRHARQRQTQGLSLQAQAAVERARALLRPQIGLSAGGSQSRGGLAQTETAVGLDWVLYDFGSASANQAAAREAWLAVLREREADLMLGVAQASGAYVDALAAFGRMQAAAQNLNSAQDNLRVAQARHEAGAATVTDKLQAETAAGQARVDFGRASTQWRLARGILATAMALPVTTELMLAGIDQAEALFQDRALDLDALIDEARARHPSVVAARARQAQADAETRAVRAERWGSVNLSARASNDRNSSGSYTGNSGASLQWQIPLTDGGVQRSREMVARGQTLVRDAEMQDALLAVSLQVWQAGQTLDGERRTVQASRLVLDTATDALRAASERFRLGVGNFSDVNTAFNAMAASRLQWVESRANVLRAHLNLAAATGRFGGL